MGASCPGGGPLKLRALKLALGTLPVPHPAFPFAYGAGIARVPFLLLVVAPLALRKATPDPGQAGEGREKGREGGGVQDG